MEETLRAMMEEHKLWVQNQLQEQNEKIDSSQQQNQHMFAQILAQLGQDKDRSEPKLGAGNLKGRNGCGAGTGRVEL